MIKFMNKIPLKEIVICSLFGGALSSAALSQTCVTATNPVHEYEGRAIYYYYYGYQYNAVGSAQYIGNYYATTSLQETSAGYWELTESCPSGAAPVITGLSSVVSNGSVNLSGTASDADGDLDKISLRYNGGEEIFVVPDSSGGWSHNTSGYVNGTYNVVAKALDLAGNESTGYSHDFTVDITTEPTAPTLNSIGVTVDATTVTITGAAADVNGNLDKVSLELSGPGTVDVTPLITGAWSYVITDHELGENFTVRAKAIDDTGLESEYSETKSYDVTSLPSVCNSNDVDLTKIDAAVNWINTYQGQYIDSIIVKHCNQILKENYYNSYTAGTLHEIQSATKTISAILIGIAMDKGIIPNDVNTLLSDLLPNYAHLLTGQKANITLKHVLTMTSGLQWEDYPGTSFDDVQAANDTVEFLLSEPLATTPGATFHYNTGSSHLLSAIIHDNTPGTTAAFAEEHLFGPLGITDYQWNATLDGVNKGGWDSFFKPLDFAKFSQLQLDEGKWQDQQIISQAYVDAMTSVQADSDVNYANTKYGYQMWINTDYGVDDIAAARGYGGQDSFVLEDLDMTVTFTGNINNPTDMAEDVATLMKNYIIPAHTDGAEPPSTGGCVTSSNTQHESAGRAYSYSGYFYATGSAAYLGYGASISISLNETSSGYWVIASGGCN